MDLVWFWPKLPLNFKIQPSRDPHVLFGIDFWSIFPRFASFWGGFLIRSGRILNGFVQSAADLIVMRPYINLIRPFFIRRLYFIMIRLYILRQYIITMRPHIILMQPCFNVTRPYTTVSAYVCNRTSLCPFIVMQPYIIKMARYIMRQ